MIKSQRKLTQIIHSKTEDFEDALESFSEDSFSKTMFSAA